MYSEIEIAKLCDALSAYKRKKAKTKIKQLIDIGKMHETVVGVAVTAVVLMAYTNRVVKKVYNKSLRMTKKELYQAVGQRYLVRLIKMEIMKQSNILILLREQTRKI